MDFSPAANEVERDAEDAKKIRPTDEDLRGVRAPFYVAEEMGKRMG